MKLTGNTYGGRVARLGAVVWLVQSSVFGPGDMLYVGEIVAILEDGTPVTARKGIPDPATSSTRSFVATASAAEVLALASGSWTWPLASRDVAGLLSAALPAPAAAVVPGDGWVTQHTLAYPSLGGTTLAVQWNAVADVAVGGQARVLVDGGSFSSTVVGDPGSFGAVDSAPVALFGPVVLAAGSLTTYTLSLQVRALGLLSSVTLTGARISCVEYL